MEIDVQDTHQEDQTSLGFLPQTHMQRRDLQSVSLEHAKGRLRRIHTITIGSIRIPISMTKLKREQVRYRMYEFTHFSSIQKDVFHSASGESPQMKMVAKVYVTVQAIVNPMRVQLA
jgi:hypothetical protein